MRHSTANLNAALQAFDEVNRQDPNTETDQAGEAQPKELLYAKRMSAELAEFAPDASQELQLAARAQHIERWIIPRADYPMNRAGYQRWRTTLGEHHAQRACGIMRQHGFSENSCQRVAAMLQKKYLKRDPEAQTLQDVVCLVFMRYYLEAFASKHSEEKLISIVRKTWKKMSPDGHASALQINLAPHLAQLLNNALGL